jgi:hypothetical protein
MRRILACCALSIAVYALVFGWLVDRPLSLGLLRLEITQKTANLAALPSPKIVILAGSNGPYSHACVVIGAMLNLPCENAGIAVGIGLDDVFARYGPLLRPGDIVYMPMELPQYTASRAQYRAGPDGGFLLRHDRVILAQLPADRILGAVFCCNLSDFLEGLAEMPIARAGGINPARVLDGEYNGQGDRIDNPLADASPALLRHPPRSEPTGPQIANGYGTALIVRFVRLESARKVVIIGGLPTDFGNASLAQRTITSLAAVYTANGGSFAMLPNHSLYPVADFFNSEDHLAQPCQYLHSIAVAYLLGEALNRPVRAPAPSVTRLAATCPGGSPTSAYAINAAR